MAGCAGDDVGVRNAFEVDGPADLGQLRAAVGGRLVGQRCEVVRQAAGKQRIEIGRGTPHVLPGLRIVPDVRAEIRQLSQDILVPLSGEPRRDGNSLAEHTVTPPAVLHRCWHITRPSGNGEHCQEEDRQL